MSGKLSDRMALGAVSLDKIWNRTAEWCETLCNCNCLGKCPTFFCTPDYAAMDKLWWKADWSTAVIFEAEYMKQASQSLEHLCVLISALEKHRDSITRIMPPYSSLESQIGSDIVSVARTCLSANQIRRPNRSFGAERWCCSSRSWEYPTITNR